MTLRRLRRIASHFARQAFEVAVLSVAAILVLVAVNMTVGLLSWAYTVIATGN